MTNQSTTQLTIMRCQFCGKFLSHGRSDRKTCSNVCRTRLHRWHNRLPAHTQRAKTEIEAIAAYLAYEPSLKPALAELTKLEKTLKALYKKYNIIEVK